MTVELKVDGLANAGVYGAPTLNFTGPHLYFGDNLAVDGDVALGIIPTARTKIVVVLEDALGVVRKLLKDQNLLFDRLQAGQFIDAAFDDQHPGHAARDLQRGR